MSDLNMARYVLAKMLEVDFVEAEACRRQLVIAELTRHETGCRIEGDRSRAAPARIDPAHPAPVCL